MRRRAFQIVLLLILGAIVNVAVAWGFGAYGAYAKSFDRTVTDAERAIAERAMLVECGVIRSKSRKVGINLGLGITSMCAPIHSAVHEPISQHLPHIVAAVGGVTFRMGAPFIITIESGYPCFAVRSVHVMCEAGKVESSGGILLWDNNVVNGHAIGWIPVMPGFAINTIFYAAMLWGGWVVFFVPGMVRRRIRRRRGLCPACAYPTWGGGSSPVCTECGKHLLPDLTGAVR